MIRDIIRSQAQLCTPGIPALRRLSQEDFKFKANLGYIVRWCLKIIIISVFFNEITFLCKYFGFY
jgi:hypothetical protein